MVAQAGTGAPQMVLETFRSPAMVEREVSARAMATVDPAAKAVKRCRVLALRVAKAVPVVQEVEKVMEETEGVAVKATATRPEAREGPVVTAARTGVQEVLVGTADHRMAGQVDWEVPEGMVAQEMLVQVGMGEQVGMEVHREPLEAVQEETVAMVALHRPVMPVAQVETVAKADHRDQGQVDPVGTVDQVVLDRMVEMGAQVDMVDLAAVVKELGEMAAMVQTITVRAAPAATEIPLATPAKMTKA